MRHAYADANVKPDCHDNTDGNSYGYIHAYTYSAVYSYTYS
jgi:hypothetical protein